MPGNKKIKIYDIDIKMEIQFGKKRQFGTIDPNVGGWGQVVPNFYKSLCYGIFDPVFAVFFLVNSQYI